MLYKGRRISSWRQGEEREEKLREEKDLRGVLSDTFLQLLSKSYLLHSVSHFLLNLFQKWEVREGKNAQFLFVIIRRHCGR